MSMPDRSTPFETDLHRVLRLLREERGCLIKLRREAAGGAERAADIEAARAHLEALQELAAAVKARMALEAEALSLERFQREDYSVLVVDDHDASRYSVSRALRASGYQTIEASAGAQALELSPYAAALVLDVHLPDLHGFEVCRLVRNEPRTRAMPILHVSAVHRSYADLETSRSVGADDFMFCPIDAGLLTQRLDGLLSQRAARA